MESSQNGNVKGGLSAINERNNSLNGDSTSTTNNTTVIGGNATPGGPPTRSRPSSKMTKYVECWGADKPFANIAESTLAKNIELTVSYDNAIKCKTKLFALFLLLFFCKSI